MKLTVLMLAAGCVLISIQSNGFCSDPLNLGPEELVQAGEPPEDIWVFGYSVPSFVDWNNDNLKDLVVGEGGGGFSAFVRVYPNVGTESSPVFTDSFYAQSNGSNLTHYWSDCNCGCLGLFPRVVYWDVDNRKDLIVGTADGYVKLFLNIGTDSDPNFDGGALLQVGPSDAKEDVNVGLRATPCIVDWNNDGKKDLAVGALDGKIHLFLNEGTDTEPNFITETFVQEDGNDLIVPTLRSSPDILDIDGDGKKDLLTGNTYGQLLFYSNVGTDSEPNFSGYVAVEANDVLIDFIGEPRSRPYVCYWTDDGYPDVLIGSSCSYGNVHLFQGRPEPGDMDIDGDVDFVDFALFADQWQQIGCGECGGAELTGDGNVDISDLKEFVENWLFGT